MRRLSATFFSLFLAATACLPMRLPAQADYAAAGALNFTEGEVNIDGQPLASRGTGAADAEGGPRRLRVGQTLATAHGSADLLLAPGALLRLGENTTVQMVSADGGRTEVRLEDGRANVSVHVVRKDHLLLVDLPNGQTQILSGGLYTFNAAGDALHVYNGEAFVFPGSDTATDVKPITVKEGHEVALGGEKPRPEKFDREVADDDLLPWTGPREARAALADGSLARTDGGSAWAVDDAADAGLSPGVYGFAGPYAYGGPYGWEDPYGFGWGPYGFGGYPFFGVGYGFWGGGFYGRTVNTYPPIKGPGSFGGHVRGGGVGRTFRGPAGRGMSAPPARGFGGGGGMRAGGGAGRR